MMKIHFYVVSRSTSYLLTNKVDRPWVGENAATWYMKGITPGGGVAIKVSCQYSSKLRNQGVKILIK